MVEREIEVKAASCLNEVKRLPMRYGDVVERGRDSVDVNKEEMRARSRVVRREGPPSLPLPLPPQSLRRCPHCAQVRAEIRLIYRLVGVSHRMQVGRGDNEDSKRPSYKSALRLGWGARRQQAKDACQWQAKGQGDSIATPNEA